MVFNSLTFVAFFVAIYATYLTLPHRWQNRLLLIASYVFYGWWDWRFLGLIALSTLVDYLAGLAIANANSPRSRRAFLLASLGTNLGILGIFKYANFFVHSLSQGLVVLGIELSASIATIVLPVGISFYTFQTMSYTIDIYRGKLSPTRNIFDFALFVSYFPQLVAGPIERARILIPQLTAPRHITRQQFEHGCWLILSGYYLKCVLADNLAPFAERVFESPELAHGFQVVVGIWAAAFQIYGDFAGYSRIAIGISKLMGIDLMSNFNRPYLAGNPSDFWKRWHISLSSWLRDYLYIPLGGSHRSAVLTYRNLFLTMLLGGLWHGAAWNFVVWGAFHGAILCLWRIRRTPEIRSHHSARTQSLRHAIQVILFFQLTCAGWVLFFAKDISDVPILLVNCVSGWEWNGQNGLVSIVVFAAPVLLMEVVGERSKRVHAGLQWRRAYRLGIYSATCVAIYLCGAVSRQSFIYFQF